MQQSRTQPTTQFMPPRTRPTMLLGLSACMESFLRSRKALDRSERTVEEYRYACRSFSTFLEGRYGADDVQLVTKRDIEDFLIDYQATRSSTTANKTFRGLRAVFNWLWREEEIEVNPFLRVVAPPVNRTLREGYAPEQVRAMLRVCQQEQRFAKGRSNPREFLACRDFALLMVLYDTGLRASEICAMTVEGINWQDGLFSVPGKGRKVYQRHLGGKAAAALDRYLRLRRRLIGEPRGSLWVGTNGEPSTRSGLRRLCALRGIHAGVKNANVHRWRYTHSEALEEQGWQEHEIMAEMGHSTLSVSRTYRDAAIRRAALRKHRDSSPADMLRL